MTEQWKYFDRDGQPARGAGTHATQILLPDGKWKNITYAGAAVATACSRETARKLAETWTHGRGTLPADLA